MLAIACFASIVLLATNDYESAQISYTFFRLAVDLYSPLLLIYFIQISDHPLTRNKYFKPFIILVLIYFLSLSLFAIESNSVALEFNGDSFYLRQIWESKKNIIFNLVILTSHMIAVFSGFYIYYAYLRDKGGIKANLQYKSFKITLIISLIFGGLWVFSSFLGMTYFNITNFGFYLPLNFYTLYLMREFRAMTNPLTVYSHEIVNNLSDCLMTFDSNWNIVELNEETKKFFKEKNLKYNKDYLPITNFLSSKNAEKISVLDEEMIISVKGIKRYILINSTLVKRKYSNEKDILVLFKDITNYKGLQAEIKNFNENLTEKVENATKEISKKNISLENQIKKTIKREKIVKELSYKDFITKLYNGDGLMNSLIGVEDSYLLFISLNEYRKISDKFDISLSDQLVKKFAARLSAYTDENSTAARFATNNFILTKKKISQELVHGIIEDLTYSYRIDRFRFNTTINIGIYQIKKQIKNLDDAQKAVNFSELACNTSIEKGVNKYEFFRMDIYQSLMRQNSIKDSFVSSLEKNDYIVENDTLYHKDYSHDYSIFALNINIMWENPLSENLGYEVAPDYNNDIKIADKINKIKFGYLYENLKPYNDEEKKYFIQLEKATFLDEMATEKLIKILNNFKDSNSTLYIEISDYILSYAMNDVKDFIKEIKNSYDFIKVGISDYGRHFASATFIRDCPVDFIKISSIFTKSIEKNDIDAQIVKTIYNIVTNLNIECMATSYTDYQFNLLKNMGFKYIWVSK